VLLTVFPEGQARDASARGSLIAFNDVSPGYFDTLRISFRRGRDFTEFDREGTAPVAIVNEAVARQLWPGKDALHKRFTIVQRPELYEVVGVVADSVIGAIGEEPTPLICRPVRQEYAPAAALIVRTTADPGAMLGTLRNRIQALDPDVRVRNVGTVQEQIEQGLWAPRMGAALLSIFGALAFILAMIGIYGVMAYSVAQRTQEFGFRIAIGAQPRDVVWMVMRQGMWLALLGGTAGAAAAVLLARLIAQLLFGIRPYDPVTLVAVVLTLWSVALLACYVPARRATRVDPLTALRSE
jgi:predicted permease